MDISNYLIFMVDNGASDLYLSPGSPVLIKINGVTKPIKEEYRLDAKQTKSLAYSIMGDRHIREFEEHWEANLALSLTDVGRFRINVMRQRSQVAIVIRAIKSNPPTIQELNLPVFLADTVMEKRGLILVAGATGSGKTSTLAAMIEHRNRNQHGHILTIEDPIEYLYKYKKSIVNQREIGTDTKSYSSALKNAMREAPDVILIGEIRDPETMREAITYAETGHLCLATVHASNCVETLDRIINFFPSDQKQQLLIDLSHNLRAIICQRLLKGIDKKQYPALEILRDSPYISDLIKRAEIDEIRDALERNLDANICTFDDSILSLYTSGKISEKEAVDSASSKHNVSVKIRLLNEAPNNNGITIEPI